MRRSAEFKRTGGDVDAARVFRLVAQRPRKTTLIGLAIFACTAWVWLVAAAPAQATVTSVSVSNLSLAENSAFSGTVATFTTDDPFDTFNFYIDWGDGTTQTGPASVTGDSGSVSASHTYAEDGTYTLMVRVTESGGSPSTQAATATVTVGESDAGVVGVAPIAVSEGTTFSGPVAYLTDSGSADPASRFSATIDWGDGTTTPGAVVGGAGSFTITGSHTYADELAGGTVRVTIFEADANSNLGSVQDQVTVTEADALTAHPLTFAASDAVPFSGPVATFSGVAATSLASDFSATVSWGDGTITSGMVNVSGGTMTVSGSHTYNSPPGNYTVAVQLTDDTPGTTAAIAGSTSTVAAGKPSAMSQSATGITVNSAMLHGTVDPNGGATAYSFQYGRTTAYGSTSPSSSAGSGNSGLAVSAALSGLMPGAIYHYRLVATNSKGTTYGVDTTFTTAALVAAVKARRGGSFLVLVNAPGPGTFNVILMAGRSVFGRTLLRARHAGRLQILVHPSPAGRRLIKRHHHIALSATVTFTPHSGRNISVTLHGLHPAR